VGRPPREVVDDNRLAGLDRPAAYPLGERGAPAPALIPSPRAIGGHRHGPRRVLEVHEPERAGIRVEQARALVDDRLVGLSGGGAGGQEALDGQQRVDESGVGGSGVCLTAHRLVIGASLRRLEAVVRIQTSGLDRIPFRPQHGRFAKHEALDPGWTVWVAAQCRQAVQEVGQADPSL
jgi:hypothetical protein